MYIDESPEAEAAHLKNTLERRVIRALGGDAVEPVAAG
jgi:hypothetical protein